MAHADVNNCGVLCRQLDVVTPDANINSDDAGAALS